MKLYTKTLVKPFSEVFLETLHEGFWATKCGQMAAWIKMALSMEVDLGPRHIVLDGDAAHLPQKGGRAPNSRPISTVASCLQSFDAVGWAAGRASGL